MKYISQLEYEHVPYVNNTKTSPTVSNVRMTGCGLCCLAMMLEHITTDTLSVQELVSLSEQSGANGGRGTDMSILAPVIASKFNLDYKKTSELSEAISHLRSGGHVIAHVVSRERGAVHGLFTDFGHYISLLSTDGKDFCYFDPSYRTEKFSTPERAGKINVDNFPYLYCDVNMLDGECEREKAKYHLFSRKK